MLFYGRKNGLLKCFLYLAGSCVFVWEISENIALVLAIVPPTVYLILCYKLTSDMQIKIAAIMSVLYAFLMAGTILCIIGNDYVFFMPKNYLEHQYF